jgi:hypothetical protein
VLAGVTGLRGSAWARKCDDTKDNGQRSLLYKCQGRLTEAKTLLRRALSDVEVLVGPFHKDAHISKRLSQIQLEWRKVSWSYETLLIADVLIIDE